MKKRYKVLISIIIVLAAIPIFDFFILRDSVMEDIYRNIYWGYYGCINRMEGISRLDDETIDGLLWMSDDTFFDASFEDGYLKDGFDVWLFIPSDEMKYSEDIDISGSYALSSGIKLHMHMSYNHIERCMTYEPIYISVKNPEKYAAQLYYDEETINQYLEEYGITEADIREYQHYILYDVVYQSWISGTRNGRKLNALDYWNIKEIDNTFSFEENVSDEETM